MEYLSDAWFEAANAALVGFDGGSTRVRIEHRLSSAGGEFRYHLVIDNNGARFDASPTRSADVILRQSVETALAVRCGEVAALEAVQDGRIGVEGDPRRLIDTAASVNAVGEKLAELDL